MTELTGMRARVARIICRERCSVFGDPPCFDLLRDSGLDWDGSCGVAGPGDGEYSCSEIGRIAEEEAGQ